MTLSIELPKSLETQVFEEAADEGLTNEQWARRIIERHFAERDSTLADVARLNEGERERLNHRRFELIQRRSREALSVAEAIELSDLQKQWDVYLSKVAPLPWDKLAELEALVASKKASHQP